MSLADDIYDLIQEADRLGLSVEEDDNGELVIHTGYELPHIHGSRFTPLKYARPIETEGYPPNVKGK